MLMVDQYLAWPQARVAPGYVALGCLGPWTPGAGVVVEAFIARLLGLLGQGVSIVED